MKKVTVLCLVLSAILYAAPFLWSLYVWWVVFLFPIPLLYAATKNDFGFMCGFLWGFCIFLLHGSGGIGVVSLMACEYWFLGIVVGLGIVLYQAICIGIVFWLFQRGRRFYGICHRGDRLLLNVLMIFCVIVWIDRGSFFIFGLFEGYPLMHPLLPLMNYPPLLFLLPIVGKQILTVLFLLLSASMAAVLLIRKKIISMTVAFAIVPWVLSIYCYTMRNNESLPLWIDQIVVFPYMTLCKSLYPIGMITSVGHCLHAIVDKYPQVECIVMPESAFDSQVLAMVPDLLALWGSEYVGKPIHIVFGASRVFDDNYYNSAHWVYNGVLQESFDKQHTMMLSERIPWWFNCHMIRSMYRSGNCYEVACGLGQRLLVRVDDFCFVPYICSELFFNELPHDRYDTEPILGLVNDSVFGQLYYSLYIQDLLVLLARLKAMMWQRDIIYVSYAHGVFIDKYGMVSQLQHYC